MDQSPAAAPSAPLEAMVASQTVIVLPAGVDGTSMGNEDPCVKEMCEWIVEQGELHAREGKLSEGAYRVGCELSKLQFNAIDPSKFGKALQLLGSTVFRGQQVSDRLDAEEKKAKELQDKYGALLHKYSKLQDDHLSLHKDYKQLSGDYKEAVNLYTDTSKRYRTKIGEFRDEIGEFREEIKECRRLNGETVNDDSDGAEGDGGEPSSKKPRTE